MINEQTYTAPSIHPQYGIIIASVFVSFVMMAPSIRSVEFGIFSVIYHLIMFVSLITPFWVLSSRSHNTLPIALFFLGHIYFMYNVYTHTVQEFGYAHLIFVSLIEAVVILPTVYVWKVFIRKDNGTSI